MRMEVPKVGVLSKCILTDKRGMVVCNKEWP